MSKKPLAADKVNYTKRDINKARKRARESRKKLVHDSIKADLLGISYGELKAEDTLKAHSMSIHLNHEIWKYKNNKE